MKQEQIDEIIASLPKDRTLFYYFKDRYALTLLRQMIENGAPIRSVKEGPFARLLDRPILKSRIASKGNGILELQDLDSLWPLDPHCYRLTLGSWGQERGRILYGQQTSRPQPNLVLHLNFSNKHDQAYKTLITNKSGRPFIYEDHPNARAGFNTLAWSRMDIDLDKGQVLIEELQTDWLRYIKWCTRYFQKSRVDQSDCDDEVIQYGGCSIRRKEFYRYVDTVIQPHFKLWEEAMLSATISFLFDEMKINKIFIHDADCGALLKQISGRLPPRSLYTDLPKKFCFKQTDEAPDFLYDKPTYSFKRLKKQSKLRFWLLEKH